MKERLIQLLSELSVRHGTFTLASGKQSDFYVDVRQTSLNADGAWCIGNLMLDALAEDVVGIGGLTMGADPVVSAVTTVSSHRGRPIHGLLIRKEPKGHGVGQYCVGLGNLPAGSKVAIVEDTTTTGGSLLKAIERAREAGLDVIQCLTVVDRQEGAAERIATAGYTLESLVTRSELT